jgi:hypothetical protein
MMGLCDVLQDGAVKTQLVADCVQLIDQQVAAKGGISGLGLKATYSVVKGIGSSYIPGAIERLLPEALNALDPIWHDGLQAGDPVAYLSQHQARAADCLLSATDARIKRTSNGLVKTSYNKLRESVKADIEAAIPGLAQILGHRVLVAQ